MLVKVDDKYIPINSISYIQVNSNCADIHLLNGKTIKTTNWYTVRDRLESCLND